MQKIKNILSKSVGWAETKEYTWYYNIYLLKQKTHENQLRVQKNNNKIK